MAHAYSPYLQLQAEVAGTEDSGGATRMARVWAAVRECKEGGWNVACIPQHHRHVQVWIYHCMYVPKFMQRIAHVARDEKTISLWKVKKGNALLG